MHQGEWSRVLRWGAVSAVSMYLLLAIGLATLVHPLAQKQLTYRLAQMLYKIPTIPIWDQWVPHESKLGDFRILHDVVVVNQFPTPFLMMILCIFIGGFATFRIRRIWAYARYRQAVAVDERLREEHRTRQQVIVNVSERGQEIKELTAKVDTLEKNNEALLTVLKETLQKDDEPPPKKRSIGFVEPEDKSSRK